MGRRIAATFGSGLLAALSSSASGQTVAAPAIDSATLRTRLAATMAPPGRAMPVDADELNMMLRQKDFGRLTARLRGARTASDVDLDLNWEQTQIYNGAGFILVYAYMYDLWRRGSALPDSGGEGLKQSAAMMLLYGFDLIALDGVKCGDVTAPGRRRDQLLTQNEPILTYIRVLPRAKRMQIGTISVAIEAATAPLRQNDDVLCSGGLDEISAGLKAQEGKQLPQVPNAPGTFGKTYAVPQAPGYQTKFVSEDIWRPRQAAARQALPASLTRTLTIPTDSAPPARAQ